MSDEHPTRHRIRSIKYQVGRWHQALTAAPVTAKVALRTGIYISTIGCSLLAAPISVIEIISSSTISPGWIRVGGTLASLFGFYYVGAAFDDWEGRYPKRFYQATIIGRIFLTVVFTALVVGSQADKGLLFLAVINVLSAWSMGQAMKSRR